MKIYTISGAHRSVGKTTFARCLKARLPGRSEIIKIGHGVEKAKPERLFHSVEEALLYTDQLRAEESLDYLIIESNRISSRLKPDLAVFLESPGGSGMDSADGGDSTDGGGEPASIANARKSAHIRIAGAGLQEGIISGRESIIREAAETLRGVKSVSKDEGKAFTAALEKFLAFVEELPD